MARRRTNRRRNAINWGAVAAGAISGLTVTAATLAVWSIMKKKTGTEAIGPGLG